MTNVLNGVTAKLERLPATVIDDEIRAFVVTAEHEGGRVKGQQLTAEPRQRHATGDTASVTMVGVPAGFWVWREQGIRPHLIRARGHEPLRLPGHPVWGPIHHPGVRGKQAWTKTVEIAEREIKLASERALGALS